MLYLNLRMNKDTTSYTSTKYCCVVGNLFRNELSFHFIICLSMVVHSALLVYNGPCIKKYHEKIKLIFTISLEKKNQKALLYLHPSTPFHSTPHPIVTYLPRSQLSPISTVLTVHHTKLPLATQIRLKQQKISVTNLITLMYLA